jgi:hypothetical protein
LNGKAAKFMHHIPLIFVFVVVAIVALVVSIRYDAR